MAVMATSTESVRYLSDDVDYYMAAMDLYNNKARRLQVYCEWVDENVPALASCMDTTSLQEDVPFNVLSVGSGDGTIDHRILSHLLDCAHPKLRSVILEPDSPTMHKYQDLVSKKSTDLQGVDFDWRQQTFQEYQATANQDDKFHFISCVNSLYYCGDLENTLKFLYDKLHSGGLLLVTVMAAEGTLGKLTNYLSEIMIGHGPFTSCYIQEACKKQNIPIEEVRKVGIQCDISSCFDPKLSQEGNILLDFMTHTINFKRDAPVEYIEGTLRLLRSQASGPEGQIIMDASNVAFIIKKQ